MRKCPRYRGIQRLAFEVEVKDGVVTVRGRVNSEKLKQRVTKVAKKAKGVKDVINEVEVRL